MSYIPEFKGPIEGYTVNYLTSNLWRVANTHTREEAMQEAYIVFLRCASRYSHVENGAHFMALYKTSLSNEFADLSTLASAARKTVSLDLPVHSDGDETFTPELQGDLNNDGELAVALRQAPREVQMVLNLFLSAPAELLELALSTWRASGKYKAEGDKAVSKMLGLPEGSTPITSTHDYFTCR